MLLFVFMAARVLRCPTFRHGWSHALTILATQSSYGRATRVAVGPVSRSARHFPQEYAWKRSWREAVWV